jgi:hypothetical protein
MKLRQCSYEMLKYGVDEHPGFAVVAQRPGSAFCRGEAWAGAQETGATGNFRWRDFQLCVELSEGPLVERRVRASGQPNWPVHTMHMDL